MPSSANVLIAEDQETDAYLIKWAFKKVGLDYNFAHVLDGQEAVDYLSGKGHYSDRSRYPFPDLLLLDLKMPRLTGFDVLSWLQSNPPPGDLPVIVLTSSDLPVDIQKARDLGATDYRVKPSGLEGMVKLAQELHDRWLKDADAKAN